MASAGAANGPKQETDADTRTRQPGAMFVPSQISEQQQQQHLVPQRPRAKPWAKYFIQRVCTNINHVLFYVVDERGMAKLAVVGTDVKLSGHFVYASVSDMTGAAPLRCTNRQKVLEWLGALGAIDLAEDHEVTLPQLAPHHWQQLHSSNPMMMKPQLDRDYNNWREDTGVLPDGRHYKHYLLVESNTGAERLAVVGEDSARLDRRYTYKALEDVGGFCFENAKAVSEWLDFVVGRSGPPNSLLKPQDKRKQGKKRRAGGGGSTGDDLDTLDQGPNPAAHLSAAGLSRYGSGTLLPGSAALQGPGLQHNTPLPYEQHYPGAAPSQQYQPALQQQPQPLGRYGSGPLQQPMGPGFISPQGGGPPPPPEPVDMAAAVQAAGEEVRQLFSGGGQQLLTFVTHVPNQGSVDVVAEMCRRLSSFVDALGLTGAPGVSAVTAVEVLNILQFLSERPASLKLLETTGIGRPVALLGCMHDVLAAHGQQLRPEAARELQPLADLAWQLASMWQGLAATAHRLSHEALS